MDYFISQIGSKEKLETYYGKTITEIKDEMRDPIKEMILVQQMKDKIISKVKISPTEVYDYRCDYSGEFVVSAASRSFRDYASSKFL